MTAPYRVLLVDDSRTARALLRAILEADSEISVVGEAADGAEAVRMVPELEPSVVLMDMHMPVMGGLEATKRIMIERPTPIIVVTSIDQPQQVEISLRAVGVGALTVTPKPAGPADPRFASESARLVTLVKALADVKLVRQRPSRLHGPARPPGPADTRTGAIRAVGVAASTGGPAALFRFLAALPRTLDVPVFVVQHIGSGFVEGLARWLASATVLPVSVAVDGAVASGGEVYLAPDDRHLLVEGDRIRLSSTAPLGGFRPSANALFESLATAYGSRAAAVVLTGMGEDGLVGATAIHAAGGTVLAQDPDSSVVFGMPRAVAAAGVVTAVGPTDDLARRIAHLSATKEA